MSPGKAGQILSQKGKQIAILKGRMRLAEFMSQPEDDFQKLIKEIKNDPLFKRLAAPESKVIKHKKFPGTSLAKFKTIPLDPTVTPSADTLEVESFLVQEEDLVSTIKKLGVDRFKEYFLDTVSEIIPEEIAEKCDLTIEEVKKVNNFVDRFYLQTESRESPQEVKTSKIYYCTIASVEKEENGFSIGFFSAPMIEGRYIINFDRLEELKKTEEFDKNELKKIKTLLDKLRLINSRKTVIYQVVQKIVETQPDFLESGNFRDLEPFTQVCLSEKIGVDASLISRAITRKAIRTPQGREIPLKTFFPTKKETGKELVRQIIVQEKNEIQNKTIKKPYSDGQIQKKLKEDYGLSISRRSVSEWRLDLRIPAAGERMPG
jgi:RNA polymerase sigma-54 factor